MSLNTDWALRWMEECDRTLSAHRDELTELDRMIGDGDHGENLARGFAAVEQRLSGIVVETPKKVLQTTANILLAAVGGASGPLYGTAFLRAARVLPPGELEAQDVAMMLVKAAEGIAERGVTEPGNKTMLDAWYPAAIAAAETVSNGADAAEVLRSAAQAAQQGAEESISMTALKGRASLLGERSIGHKDPGAASTALILAAAASCA